MLAVQIQKIVIIGAGRLATHLGLAFSKQGLNVVQVFNRSPENGQKLAARIGAAFIPEIKGLTLSADLYILAVSDSALSDLASDLRFKDKMVVHASGTVAMDVLAPISANIGVFYPLQTFSKSRRIDFRRIPVCIEANSKRGEAQLTALAGKLSQRVYCLDSEKRRLLHLGAVFASNFTNYLYSVTEDILVEHGIPIDLLEPLIIQTARNVMRGNLYQSQTGPAVRGDEKVLEKQRELLAQHPDYLEIYNLITKNIIKSRSQHGKL